MLIESFSGIRGIYKKDFGSETVRKYAFAFYKFLKKENKNIKIVIGSDTRESSEEIKQEFVKVFTHFKSCVIDVGFNTTPVIELAVKNYNANGGVIVTASHNPQEYNGFKFLAKNGAILNDEEIKKVINKSKIVKLEKISADIKNVKNMHEDSIKRYIDFIIRIIGDKNIELIKNSDIKILLDPNGGSGCVVLNELFDKIGLKVSIRNNKVGFFNREIEPNEKTLSYLIPLIKTDFDFAAGFDCDADRVELVTNEGVISGQYVLALVIDEILSEIDNPEKASVVVNDATSYLVKEIVEAYEAKFVETETGEINVVNKMQELNAVIGGEGSNGGVIIPGLKCRDGILTLIMILKIIAKKNKKLKEIIKEMPRYYTLNLKLNCDSEKHFKIREKLKEYFLKNKYGIKETESGLKVLFENGWIWYRASKTEKGIYRIYSDSKKKEIAENLLREGEFILRDIERKIE